MLLYFKKITVRTCEALLSSTCSHNLIQFVIDLQDFSSSWDIRATPMFFLKNGQQIGKLVGANKSSKKKVQAAADGASAKS